MSLQVTEEGVCPRWKPHARLPLREIEGCCASSITCTLISKCATLPLPLSRGDARAAAT